MKTFDYSLVGGSSSELYNMGTSSKYTSNSTNYKIINGTSSRDSIYNSGQYVKVRAKSGADTIYNYNGDHSSINGGSGNDSIYAYDNDYVTIRGGDGRDTIRGGYYNSKIYGGAGRDFIDLWGSTSNNTVDAGAGNDTIDVYGGSIRGGSGNDSIYYHGSSNGKIDGGSGNDTIYDYNGDYASINGGSGNDSIYAYDNDYVTVRGGDGKDTIRGGYYSSKIYGGAGRDYISIGGSSYSNTVDGGSGDDYIGLAYGGAVIGGTGNDTISGNSSYSKTYQYAYGDGNDIIYGHSSTDTLKITSGAYMTSTVNGNVIVSVTSGANSTVPTGAITLVGASNHSINIVGDTVTVDSDNPIYGTNYNDTLRGSDENVTIYGYGGNDSIYNKGYYGKIYAGDGNDTVNNQALYCFINAGDGNDSVESYGYATISGGYGNDTISAYTGSSISGGYGYDVLKLRYAGTVNGGAGNDTIYGNSSSGDNILYQYAYGDGNDIIYSQKSTDTLKITSGAYMTSTDGNNVIVSVTPSASSTVAGGTITLSGAAGNTLNIVGTKVTVKGGGSNTPQEVIKKFMGVLDTMSSSASSATLRAVSVLNQAVKVASNNKWTTMQQAINSMVSDCSSYGSSNATAFLRDKCGIDFTNYDTGAITGSDAGTSTTKTAESVVPESGSKYSYTYANNQTYYLSNYGLTLKLTDSSYTYDKKHIWDCFNTWWAPQSLKLIDESYDYSFKDSDATPKVLDLAFVNEDGFLASTGYNGNDLRIRVNLKYYNSFSSTDYNGKSPNGQKYLDRTLAHEMTHAIMMAKCPNFWDLPQYITEGTADLTHGTDDTRGTYMRSLAADSTSLSRYLNNMNSGTGDNYYYAAGYMFLRYLAKQSSNLANSDVVAEAAIVPIPEGMTVNGKVATVSESFEEKEIDLSSYQADITKLDVSKLKSGINIFGNSNDNSIKTGAGADTISAGAGNDTVNAGKGSDFIYGGSGDDKLFGEVGNDTLYGGIGNDTLTGGAGKDVFVYEDGQDVITDYSAGDEIDLCGNSIQETVYSGQDVTYKIGDGTLTVKDGKDKSITFVDRAKEYGYLPAASSDEIFAEDNFATADSLSSIVNNDSAVSLSEIPAQNFDTLTQENLITCANK